MSRIDYINGYRMADEELDASFVNCLDVLVSGQQDWQRRTAKRLIEGALLRQSEGVNHDYHDGVMARASEALQ